MLITSDENSHPYIAFSITIKGWRWCWRRTAAECATAVTHGQVRGADPPEQLARLLLRLVRLAPMPADPLRVRKWHRQASDCRESRHRPTYVARPGFEPLASPAPTRGGSYFFFFFFSASCERRRDGRQSDERAADLIVFDRGAPRSIPMGPIGTHWDPTDGLQHAGGAAARAPAEALARTRAARASPPAPALARSRAARSRSSAVGPHLRACDDHRSDLVCDVFGLCLPQGISQSFFLLIFVGSLYFVKPSCAFVR